MTDVVKHKTKNLQLVQIFHLYKSKMVSLVGASSNTLYGVISDVDAKLVECGLIIVGKKVVDIGGINPKQNVSYDAQILYSGGKS